jgi:hypothetical protein
MSDDLPPSAEDAYRSENVRVIKPPGTFYGLLAMIREQPRMLLGQKSLRVLDAWLHGYRYAKMEAGSPLSAEEDEFRQFDAFVCEKYRWLDTGGWVAKVAYCHRDDADAFDEFFKLLDEFRAAKQSNRPADQGNPD